MLTCTGYVSAQKDGKPDFTGTWVFDEDKSKGPYGTKPEKYSVLHPNEERTLTIVIRHNGPQLNVAEKRLVEFFDDTGKFLRKEETDLSSLIYYTDGRGESNSYSMSTESPKQSSVTKWSGKEILVSLAWDESMMLNGKKLQPPTFVFSISKNGKELKIGHMGNEIKFEADDRNPGIVREYSVRAPVFGQKVYRKVE